MSSSNVAKRLRFGQALYFIAALLLSVASERILQIGHCLLLWQKLSDFLFWSLRIYARVSHLFLNVTWLYRCKWFSCILAQDNEADAERQSVCLPAYQEPAVNYAADFYVNDAIDEITVNHVHPGAKMCYRSDSDDCGVTLQTWNV